MSIGQQLRADFICMVGASDGYETAGLLRRLPADAFPSLRHFVPGALARALDERRPGPQQWILATPRLSA
ncbi:MAG: hypothetical protein NTX19_08060 [Gemmatimonadetes bacterium]|nr:hypothetical protein [Gemmatimonadota bacterium]